MLHKSFIFLILSSFLYSSCSEDSFTQVVEIDPPAFDKQMTLHLLLSDKDSFNQVQLGQNFGILENVPDDKWFLKNGSIEIFENNLSVLKYTENNDLGYTFYNTLVAPNLFSAGKTYELRVKHPDFEDVTATQKMPSELIVEYARYRENAGTSNDPDLTPLEAIDVLINDKAGEKNYYEMEVLASYPQLQPRIDSLTGGYIYDQLTGQLIYDTIGYYEYAAYPESSEDINAVFGTGNSLLISDKDFDGQKYKFSFRKYRSGDKKFLVYVRSITEETYQYSASTKRKSDAEDNPLAEPVNSFSNLKGGIGIFALKSEKKFRIE
jgi:Domain of unknown function (DUF4249)